MCQSSTANKTIGIQIIYNSTDSYSNYLIDYNDTSLIAFPTAISSTTVVYHTFPRNGYYNVNVTVFNQVSSMSANVLVCLCKIYLVNKSFPLLTGCFPDSKIGFISGFTQFDCDLKWRMYENDNAIDNDVTWNSSTSVYTVLIDYNLRFFCTWDNSTCKYALFSSPNK
jgi:hypothetical protein